MSLLEQIQQDQAKRQVLVTWRKDQLAITTKDGGTKK